MFIGKTDAEAEAQYFGHLIWRANSMGVSLSKLQDIVKYREAWHATVHGVTKNLTWLSDWTNKQKFPKVPRAAHFPLISFNEVVS